ncbi:MAG: hypothetical protein GXZ15_02700 [Campylobacter sp.]|nr:hypothetical protein [Campylobacter sp.]
MLNAKDILDLRVEFYDKFYLSSVPYMRLKFIKDGKVVSCWAKVYRGIALKHISENNV